jgi:hypothetical protein
MSCDFKDPDSISRGVENLIDYEDIRTGFGERAYRYSRDMIWPNVAMRYVNARAHLLGLRLSVFVQNRFEGFFPQIFHHKFIHKYWVVTCSCMPHLHITQRIKKLGLSYIWIIHGFSH